MINKDELENNLNRVHEWIKAADQKVSILFALEGIVITILFSDTVVWMKEIIKEGRCYSSILVIVGIVLILFSIYKSALAIIPRLKKKSAIKSLLYFGDVAKMKLSDFKDDIRKVSKENYEEQLMEQIHTCSIIAFSKHEHLKDSAITFLLGMVLLLFACMIKYYGF